jgi:F-type H+-transporting ATPase subunit a
MKLAVASILLALASARVAAQPEPNAHQTASTPADVDIITPHITDSYEIELPYWRAPFTHEVCLGRHDEAGECRRPLWNDLHLGPVTINLSPTKHVVMLGIAAVLAATILILTARAHKRHTHEIGRPRGFAAGIEALVLWLRNDVVLANVGPHGEGYVPFLLTLFFFILTANVLGLIPYLSTATGNISVTATLAIITFLTVEIAGIRANGLGYLNSIFYWNRDLPIVMRVLMFIIVSPVELVGKFTKPFALAIRLFANMTAGHIVVLALIGLIFTFGGVALIAPFFMAVAVMLLELLVAFIQAFIFTLLSSVFIVLMRESHH